MSPESPCRARFIFASGTVSSVFSAPKMESLRVADSWWRSTNFAHWTNMPPEPQAGSKTRPWNGSQDLDDQPDDRVRREVLTTALALLGGEVGEEVLVDEAEGVAFELGRQRREEAQQLDQGRALQLLVAARQDVLQLGVGGLDGLDRLVDGLADVVALGQPDQVGQPGLVGDVEHRLGLVVRDRRRVARASPWPRPRRARPRSGSRRTRGTPARAPGRGTAPG